MQHARAPDLALRGQVGLVHACAVGGAGEDAVGELVDHHALEDVGLICGVVLVGLCSWGWGRKVGKEMSVVGKCKSSQVN